MPTHPINLEVEKELFWKEIEALSDTELLDKKVEFDSLPPPGGQMSDLRTIKSLCLEAILKQRFGCDKWYKALDKHKSNK